MIERRWIVRCDDDYCDEVLICDPPNDVIYGDDKGNAGITAVDEGWTLLTVPCGSCGEPALTEIILDGEPTPACLRHYNHWRTPATTSYECWCGHECALAHELRLAYGGRLSRKQPTALHKLWAVKYRATRRPTRSESGFES